jgi:hypothetical protein
MRNLGTLPSLGKSLYSPMDAATAVEMRRLKLPRTSCASAITFDRKARAEGREETPMPPEALLNDASGMGSAKSTTSRHGIGSAKPGSVRKSILRFVAYASLCFLAGTG